MAYMFQPVRIGQCGANEISFGFIHAIDFNRRTVREKIKISRHCAGEVLAAKIPY